jgi:hypothetical protein
MRQNTEEVVDEWEWKNVKVASGRRRMSYLDPAFVLHVAWLILGRLTTTIDSLTLGRRSHFLGAAQRPLAFLHLDEGGQRRGGCSGERHEEEVDQAGCDKRSAMS